MAQALAEELGLTCVMISGDGRNVSYVSELSADDHCVILEATRLWDNDTRDWISNLCHRLRGRVVIARSPCADLEFINTPQGFRVVAHPSAKFPLLKIYSGIDYIEYSH